MSLDRLLRRLGACDDGAEWARGKSLAKAWATCQDARWMLWFAGRLHAAAAWQARAKALRELADLVRLHYPEPPTGEVTQ